MAKSAWRVRDFRDVAAGRRYTVTLGDMEWLVLHVPGGWQFWDGHARCEANPAVKAAVLDFEKTEPYDDHRTNRRWSSTAQDIHDEAVRTGFDG